jgi:hypothetical protein
MTESQVVIEAASVRLDGIGGKTQVCLDLQPRTAMLLLCDKGVALPTDGGHRQLLSRELFCSNE